jgi:hypothetical protein
MRTSQAVTAAPGVPVGYGVLGAIYLLLIAGIGWALWRLARSPLGEVDEHTVSPALPEAG